MKVRIAVLFLFLIGTTVYAQQASDSGYPVKIHVTSCFMQMTLVGMDSNVLTHLDVMIDGKKFQLTNFKKGEGLKILHPGNYQARIKIDKEKKSGADTSYESETVYEIRFPDGKTREYLVSGESE